LDLNSSLGLLRSLLIYYGRPLRIRQLARLYAGFIGPGDLAFDLGAHVGVHLHAMVRLGARVVAVEPQPALFAFLKRVWGRHPRVTLLPLGVGAEPGRQQMYISRRNPTVSSLSKDWVKQVGVAPAFARVRWDRPLPVRVTTLDALVSEFGQPRFCKIDVEGSEHAVLRGLGMPVRALSFEYQVQAPEIALDSLQRLRQLGQYEYNWSPGEHMRLQRDSWLEPDEMEAWLASLPAEAGSGDVYARLRLSQAKTDGEH
jgi:FkbM family methyltransferase